MVFLLCLYQSSDLSFGPAFLVQVSYFCAVVLAVLHILYEEVFEVRLAVTSFIFIMGMFAETIVCIVGAMLGYSVETARETTELFLLYNILSRLIWFIEIKTAFVLQKKNRTAGIRKTDWLEVFFVPVSSIFIIVSIFEPYAEQFFTLKLVASFLLLVINLLHTTVTTAFRRKLFTLLKRSFSHSRWKAMPPSYRPWGRCGNRCACTGTKHSRKTCWSNLILNRENMIK